MLRDRSVATMSMYVGDIYGQYRDEDGFLYASYAAQEMYGGGLRLQQQQPSASKVSTMFLINSISVPNEFHLKLPYYAK